MEGWAEEIQRKGPRGSRRGFPPPFRWLRHGCAMSCLWGALLPEDFEMLSVSQAFGEQPPGDIS